MFDIIVACDEKSGIGKNGKLPWKDKSELEFFKQITQNSVLIMGRVTVESLPKLENRRIICVTSKSKIVDKNNSLITESLEHAIYLAGICYPDKRIFVAGGEKLYKEAMKRPDLHNIHMSVIKGEHDCDKFFTLDSSKWLISEQEDFPTFEYRVLQRSKPNGEHQYLSILENVLQNGETRICRNGETKSLFFGNMTFDLRLGFPLLTTKKMFFKGILEEFLFFIKGETDTKLLESKNVNIWKGNTDRSFLDGLGMTERKEGLMGPMYGYQWRFFGATYNETTGKPSIQGIDQLKNVIDTIRTDPTSRRIIMTDYNPSQVSQGVLPPCHSIVVQFYVRGEYIDMFCYNRSQDLFLGTPFNIASSALLLSLVAKETGHTPCMLHISMGDMHIYKEHYQAVEKQLSRVPFRFPHITIDNENGFEKAEITLQNYLSHPPIKAQMVA